MLTDEKLKEAITWKERVEESIQNALSCYEWMRNDDLLHHEHALAGLAKHVQDTTDSIKEFDNVTNRELLARLVEVPDVSKDKQSMSWRNVIKTREILVHHHWETDFGIVREAVRSDFPKLANLFGTLYIHPKALTRGGDPAKFDLDIKGSDWPTIDGEFTDLPLPGTAMIFALYGKRDGWQLLRVFQTEEMLYAVVLDPNQRPMSVRVNVSESSP